jgi:DNA-binding winged helix-turn-helix (wHTH) protein
MPVYRFGDFALDTRSGELRRGAYRVRLRPQPAALLEHLLKHAGEVVTREDLRQVLWPDGTYVHFDHGLNSCIKQLRAALLDHRAEPRFLETLPRRGYRFVGQVVAEPSAPAGTEEPPGEEDPNGFVVSGTAAIESGRLRVRIQLIDRRTGSTVWSTEFDAEAGDMPAAQTRISAAIVDGLTGRLGRQATRAADRTGHARAAMM